MESNKLIKGVTAHRGDSSSFPENTEAAFRAALRLKVDWIETDVRRSRDGELVIMHDSHLGRVAGVDAKVRELSLADLLRLDLGQEGQIHPVMSLEQALACIRGSLTRLSLQPKSDCVDQIVGLVKNLGMTSQVGFNDHDLEKMSRVRSLLTDVPVFWDRITPDLLGEELKIARQQDFQAIVMYDPNLTRSTVEQVQDAGLAVGAWTVNCNRRFEELLDWGIDRIYTDDPGALIRTMQPD